MLAQTSRRGGRDGDSDDDADGDDDDDDSDKGASDKCERREGTVASYCAARGVPTDIHQHVYRKCNYSLKGSSILSDPSRSKWVLH